MPTLLESEMDRVAAIMAEPNGVFVFGSNVAGRHGGGAAWTAFQKYGAQWGVGEGFSGRTYAIPTMVHLEPSGLSTRSLQQVGEAVERFKDFARAHPELRFGVTRIACGIAGFTDDEVAPLFDGAPFNCELPPIWRVSVA